MIFPLKMDPVYSVELNRTMDDCYTINYFDAYHLFLCFIKAFVLLLSLWIKCKEHNCTDFKCNCAMIKIIVYFRKMF